MSIVVHVDFQKRERQDLKSLADDLFRDGCKLDEDPSTMSRAEEMYRHAIDLDPTHVGALTNLGNIRFKFLDLSGAFEFYHRSLDIDKNHVDSIYNIGFTHHHKGSLFEAVQWYERALKISPNFGDAHFNLASALESLGEKTRSLKHFKAYLKISPNTEFSEIARSKIRANRSRKGA